MINPEDSDGGGSSEGFFGGGGNLGDRSLIRTNTIRLLRGPATIMVDSNNTFTADSVGNIAEGDLVYINSIGNITTKKPDDSAPIIGIVMNVDNNNVRLTIEPGIAVAYNHIIELSGGIVMESSSYDPKKTIGYGNEHRFGGKPKVVGKVASEKDRKKKGGATKTTIDEDMMNALLGG